MPPASTPQHAQRLNSDQPVPDYSFLNEKPKRPFQLPSLNFKGNSFTKRLIVAAVAAVLLIILIVILKNLLTTQPFSKPDYLLVAERQQQMLHILTSDISSSNSTQLSTSNQDFVSTASLSLQTAQNGTLRLLSEDGDKVSTSTLQGLFSSSIDSQISSALAASNINPVFKSIINTQLNYYLSDISTAFDSTNVSAGKILLRSDYKQAKLLQAALDSSNS